MQARLPAWAMRRSKQTRRMRCPGGGRRARAEGRASERDLPTAAPARGARLQLRRRPGQTPHGQLERSKGPATAQRVQQPGRCAHRSRSSCSPSSRAASARRPHSHQQHAGAASKRGQGGQPAGSPLLLARQPKLQRLVGAVQHRGVQVRGAVGGQHHAEVARLLACRPRKEGGGRGGVGGRATGCQQGGPGGWPAPRTSRAAARLQAGGDPGGEQARGFGCAASVGGHQRDAAAPCRCVGTVGAAPTHPPTHPPTHRCGTGRR